MCEDDKLAHRLGDKVRIKQGTDKGKRAVIVSVSNDYLGLNLEGDQDLQIAESDVTNFSLAARKAWQTLPKRAGRPKLALPRKKMVSLRLDMSVWKDLSRAAEFGLIGSREQAVNEWVRERLNMLLDTEPDSAQEREYLPVKNRRI